MIPKKLSMSRAVGPWQGFPVFHGCRPMSKLKPRSALAFKALGLGTLAGINLLYGSTFNPISKNWKALGPWPQGLSILQSCGRIYHTELVESRRKPTYQVIKACPERTQTTWVRRAV
jgi:hypothetical protein